MFFAADLFLQVPAWMLISNLDRLLSSWLKVCFCMCICYFLFSCVLIQTSQPYFVKLSTSKNKLKGKELACAVGMVKMTPDDIRANPKGVALENLHYLNDGLWVAPKVA